MKQLHICKYLFCVTKQKCSYDLIIVVDFVRLFRVCVCVCSQERLESRPLNCSLTGKCLQGS